MWLGNSILMASEISPNRFRVPAHIATEIVSGCASARSDITCIHEQSVVTRIRYLKNTYIPILINRS